MKMHELRNAEWLPYALVKIKDAPYEHCWLPVNRDYERPEGMRWDYDAHIADAMVFSRDPRTFNCWIGDTTGNYLYLYDRGDDLAADYAERLERLLSERWCFVGGSVV